MTATSDKLFTSDHGGRQKDRRAEYIAQVDAALARLQDPEALAIMPGNKLAEWGEHALPAVIGNVARYTRIRIQQSFSKPRARALEEDVE